MKYDTKNSFGKRMVRESKIQEIGKPELPEIPTTEGSYSLQVEVDSEGNAVLTWEEIEG